MHHYLSMHPDVFMSKKKELHFFDNESYFSKPDVKYDEYQKNFSNDLKLLGETTPIYFYWLPVAERVFRYSPQMKWVIILRNPIDRAYSQWNMEYARKKESLLFRDAIEAELIMQKIDAGKQCRIRSYLDRGRYEMQIKRLLKWFNSNQILFVKYENFLGNPGSVLDEVCAFLDIGPMCSFKQEKYNSINYQEVLSVTDWVYLMDHLGCEIDAVESFLGWDCGDWRIFNKNAASLGLR